MNSLDIVCIGLIGLGGLIGGKLGLFRSLSSLVGFIVAGVLTRWTAPYVVTFISKSTIDEKISGWIEGKTGVNQWQAQYQVWMEDPQVKAALAQQGLGDVGRIFGQQSNMADMGAQLILFLVSSIGLFIIFKFLLNRILKMTESYSIKLPILAKFNTLGGAISGALVASFFVIIALAIWIPLSSSQDVSKHSFLNSEDSFAANTLIPALGIEDYLPFHAAKNWFAPMMARSNPSVESVNAGAITSDSGHDDYYAQQSKIITLANWFGSTPKTYEEKEISAKVDCKSGDCLDWDVDSEPQVIDCWFCESEWVGIRDNRFVISSDGSYSSDTLAGCTQKTHGPILNEMNIIQKTEELLVVQGNKIFNKSQSGKCDVEYESTVEIMTEWRFYKP